MRRAILAIAAGVLLLALAPSSALASDRCEAPTPSSCREHAYTRAVPGQVLTVNATNDTNRDARVIITLQRAGWHQVERTVAAYTVGAGEPFAFSFVVPASWRHAGVAHAYIAQGPPVCVDETGELLSVSIG